MSEFIGRRISLISKSDIRYVGVLAEINSEASTVSLSEVCSFGTEGRRGGDQEFGPSDTVYDQIVFRGSDVKDLRIEDPKEEQAAQPAMPQDPAIIDVQQSQQSQRQDNIPQDQQRRQQPPPNFPQPGQFPPGGYPPFGAGGPGAPYPNRFGPQGGFPGGPFPGPPGAFGMPPPPYGAPPGWFPPGQGFNQPPGPFPPHMGMGPPGFPGPHNVINQNQAPSGSRGPPSGPHASKDEIAPAQTKVVEADGMSKPAEQKAGAAPGATSTPAAASKQAPPPPVDSKPDVASALAPPHPQHAQQPPKPAAGGSGGRIIPAVPIPSPKVTKTTHRAQQPAAQTAQAAQPAVGATQQNATQLATAAVAAAMAKLNVQNASQPPTSDPLNNLAQKVEGMREQQSRTGRQPAAGGFRGRGGRGGRGAHQQHPKMEVPTTDFDFESSNAKFNKQDLVKEAIATGSPLGDASTAPTIEAVSIESSNEAETDDVIIPPSYNKGSSFFDNISSELKDREEASSKRGQEFRTEERRKNMETFGQGSVDGYRGGFRGRGRGRGRSRGLNTRGRSAPRGRGGAEFGEAA